MLDVAFIENYQKNRIIHFNDGSILKTKSTWEEIVNQLPPNMFCFVQRSFLINFHNVSS
ncbi:LytTR family transcriptional regulator DNA-binding domain-containing protein, partial [Ruminiclostridium josui]|uniref:LytTR family transcriptional regulator DNA-binding domain-containing protein n=1 Tax=Ruminiclostridium josui TaxID=1499 RepID=UPI003BF52056